MRPSVYTNVVFELLACAKKNGSAVADVGANHKAADILVLTFEDLV